MEPFTRLTSHMVAIPTENIDTDQIIPARFLKTISKTGLGTELFADWRYESDGSPKADFELNQPAARGAAVLIAGDNFGCGSSREHAPWALLDHGIRAVISTSFADIFRNNSLKNGLLPVEVDPETHRQLLSLVAEDPEAQVTVDLMDQLLTLPDGREVSFSVDNFSRTCLIEGTDQLGFLMKQGTHITEYELAHSARVNTLGG
jgi:3-isopropylmalate/(R)-2-methylmalate dehydratase small subunit